MLDTNILIYFIKNKPASVVGRINRLAADDVLCMSFVSWAELLEGAERSTRKPDVLRRLEELTRQVAVSMPTGVSICSHYAVQATRLRAAGTPIGGATLVSNDVAEFGRIEGLVLENWAR
jgi:tRNA(fMet)-specific endonuclease VapC